MRYYVKMLIQYIFVFMVSCSVSYSVIGQTLNLNFRNITKEDGLTSESILTLVNDPYGFMWFGTEAGLHRYDGYEMTLYRTIAGDTSSLCYNEIRKLLVDADSSLWVVTMYGVDQYSFTKNNFTHYPFVKEGIEENVQIGEFIDCGKNGFFVEVEGGGYYRLKKNDIAFRPFSLDSIQRTIQKIADSEVGELEFLSVENDVSNNLWFGTGNQLISIDANLGLTNKYNLQIPATSINVLFRDKDHLWIGADDGLYSIDLLAKAFAATSVNFAEIISVHQSQQSGLWLCSEKNIIAYDPPTDESSVYQLPGIDEASDIMIASLVEDTEGNFWVGTDPGGVFFTQVSSTEKFTYYKPQSSPYNHLPNSTITCLSNSKNGDVWIGTQAGLYLFDRANHSIFPQHTSDTVSFVMEDSRGRLWVTLPDRVTRFQPMTTQPRDFFELNDQGILFEDSKRRTWYASGNLKLFNDDLDTFEEVTVDEFEECHHLFEDHNGNLWLSTDVGLLVYNHNQEKIFRYRYVHGLSNNYVLQTTQDHDGNLWVATSNGLDKVEERGEVLEGGATFRHYKHEDGLVDDHILSVTCDYLSNLWVSMVGGFAKFNQETDRFINFTVNNGLVSPSLNSKVILNTLSGEIMLGGVGFNLFDPKGVLEDQHLLPIYITDIQIYGKSVPIGEVQDRKKPILKKSLWFTEEIELSYQENMIAFEFVAPDYKEFGKNEYKYRLEGLEESWNYTSAKRRFASYSNLAPGEYVFKVSASNDHGLWNEAGTRLRIIIHPPFWSTWWFRIVSALVVISMVIALYWVRIKHIYLQKKALETQVAERTKELQKANSRIRELNQSKLDFFTNISHELRTPLTLMLGPLERVIAIHRGNRRLSQQLEIMKRNGHRLLHLINQLMDFKKIETGHLTLHASRGDIVGCVRNAFSSFEELAQQQGIMFTFHCDVDPIYSWFDSDKLDKILSNLIYNAFKHTPRNGKIDISVRLIEAASTTGDDHRQEEAFHTIEISVTDTGHGIPADKIKRIFNRFYQVNYHDSSVTAGTGLGLALAKDLVKLHKGRLTVVSEEGRGSCFTVTLPADKCRRCSAASNYVGGDGQHGDTLADRILITNKPFIQQASVEQDQDQSLILIVEDNPDFRRYISDIFCDNYKLIEAENGRQGLVMAQQHRPALIISDIMMPEMDGIAFCRSIKDNVLTSHIPIIMLTAKHGTESKLFGLQEGADDYMTKPFNADELEARVVNLIESRKKLRKRFIENGFLRPQEVTVTHTDEKFLTKAMDAVMQHMDDPAFNIDMLASLMNMSRSSFFNKVKSLTDLSPKDFVQSIRLKRAKCLLKKGQLSIAEVCYEVGYSSPDYFGKKFRKQFGMSPTQYIHNHQ